MSVMSVPSVLSCSCHLISDSLYLSLTYLFCKLEPSRTFWNLLEPWGLPQGYLWLHWGFLEAPLKATLGGFLRAPSGLPQAPSGLPQGYLRATSGYIGAPLRLLEGSLRATLKLPWGGSLRAPQGSLRAPSWLPQGCLGLH